MACEEVDEIEEGDHGITHSLGLAGIDEAGAMAGGVDGMIGRDEPKDESTWEQASLTLIYSSVPLRLEVSITKHTEASTKMGPFLM